MAAFGVNNPAMAGFAEAHYIYGDADYLVVSIGTGDRQDHLRYEQVKKWGLAQWAREIAPVFMESTSEAADQELYFILGKQRHFRFQAELIHSSNDMDCVTAENIENLQKDAEACIREDVCCLVRALRAACDADTIKSQGSGK